MGNPIVITNAECNLKKYSYSDIDTCDILYGYLMYSSGFYKISFVGLIILMILLILFYLYAALKLLIRSLYFVIKNIIKIYKQ